MQPSTLRPDQLQVGMFVARVGRSWLDHDFWGRSSFLITERAQIERLIAGGVAEVVIDLARSTRPAPPAPRPERGAQSDAPAPPLQGTGAAGELAAELRLAQALAENGKRQIDALFNQARLGRAIDLDPLHALAQDVAASLSRHPSALIALTRLRSADDYTYLHCVAVSALMQALARGLGLPDDECRRAGFAGLVHDAGKALVPLPILNKPQRLTAAEFDIVRRHPGDGSALLHAAGVRDDEALDAVRHHHEKVAGGGYPDGLSGDSIGRLARMAAICDVYDAVTAERIYHEAWAPNEAIQRMASWKGHFDAGLFQHFVKAIGIYPVGSWVRLRSHRLAVVVRQSPASLLRPTVQALYCVRRHRALPAEELRLDDARCDDAIVGRESPADWPLPSLLDCLHTAPASTPTSPLP